MNLEVHKTLHFTGEFHRHIELLLGQGSSIRRATRGVDIKLTDRYIRKSVRNKNEFHSLKAATYYLVMQSSLVIYIAITT